MSAVAPAHVSECSTKQVRGRITGMFQMFQVMTAIDLISDRLRIPALAGVSGL